MNSSFDLSASLDPTGGSPFGRPRRSPGVVAAGLFSIAFVGMLVSLLVMVIWPGSFTLFAPLLCSGELPDAYVVVDRSQVVPGETSFNVTMYCVGARGEADEVGFIRPFLLLLVTVTVVLAALGLVMRARSRRRTQGVSLP